MNKLDGGVYEDIGKHHRDYYKMIGNCVYRLSVIHKKWILCIDENIISQIKEMENVNE